MSDLYVSCSDGSDVHLVQGRLDIAGAGVARVWYVNGEWRLQHNDTAQNGRIFLHTGEEVPFTKYNDGYVVIPEGYGLRAEYSRKGSEVKRTVRIVPLR